MADTLSTRGSTNSPMTAIRTSATMVPAVTRSHRRLSGLIMSRAPETLRRQPDLPENEGIGERDFAQVVVTAGSPAMPGVHVDLEQQRVVVGLAGAQLGHVFGRFPVHHLAVVERSFHQQRRIGLALDVVVG